jgi:hypothetical protein
MFVNLFKIHCNKHDYYVDMSEVDFTYVVISWFLSSFLIQKSDRKGKKLLTVFYHLLNTW